uniref:Integrase core domain containing protein n=1 Tax=Solanum tuberosum TaxID=4113 RepID=M1DSX9_SOLTU
MQQPFEIAFNLLDGMTNINRAWYTQEDQVSPLTLRMTKEKIEKHQERDQNMAKMMTQLDILSKNLMGNGPRVVNVVGITSGANPENAHFKALCNEEVNFLANQGGGFHPSYLRQGRNPGSNRERDDGWRDRDR